MRRTWLRPGGPGAATRPRHTERRCRAPTPAPLLRIRSLLVAVEWRRVTSPQAPVFRRRIWPGCGRRFGGWLSRSCRSWWEGSGVAELRSFIFLNRLQPQTMCYLGTWIRGSLPRSDVAAQIIEVAPGLDIEPVTDVALKHAGVQAGVLVVERQFGYLEIHGGNDEVSAAGSAVLEALGVSARDAMRPVVLASKIISMLDPQHAFLINRNKIGSMALAGESLFVLEMQPASYAILAANEAEKAARVKLVDYRMIGATGRLYLSGTESDVRQAAEAAEDALRDVS